MTGRIFTADHQVYDLPPLLAWNVKHTGTVPCDSWSVTAVYKAAAVSVKLAGSFGAFPGDRVALRLEKLGLAGLYRAAETENRFSAREGAVMIWTLKECE